IVVQEPHSSYAIGTISDRREASSSRAALERLDAHRRHPRGGAIARVEPRELLGGAVEIVADGDPKTLVRRLVADGGDGGLDAYARLRGGQVAEHARRRRAD